MSQSIEPTSKEDLIALLCDSYSCAREDYIVKFKSKHWDVFPEGYGDKLSDPSVWPNFRNNGLTAGFDIGWTAPGIMTCNANQVSEPGKIRRAIERYESLKSIVGADFISEYHEANVGNPEYVEHRGLRLNTTDMRHLHDAWRLQQFYSNKSKTNSGRPIIIDIGGGFGGLAAKIKQIYPDALVVLLDLPEVNAVQTYYLKTRFPNSRLLTYRAFKETSAESLIESDYDFAVLPGWTLDFFPDNSIDLAVNTRSMMEMNKSVVDHYISEIGRTLRSSGVFYCVNRYIKTTVGEKICIKEYAFDDHWYLAVSGVAWDQHWLHELVAVRTELPVSHPGATLLEALPPYRWSDVFANLKRTFVMLWHLTWGGHHNTNPGVRGRVRHARINSIRWLLATLKRNDPVYRAAKKLTGRG